jgi:hypothetical protein
MGIFWSRPAVQQPVVITTPGVVGQPGQTTVIYGAQTQPYGYGYDPALLGVALVADIATDVIVDEMIIDNMYGGKKEKKSSKKSKSKDKKPSKIIGKKLK